MSWQDLGSIGELVSAIAVVISLVYLAFQIRQNTSQIDQNTQAVRASAFDSSIHHAMFARQAIFEHEDVSRLYHHGILDPDSLNDEERTRLRLMIHNIMWSIWNIQLQGRFSGVSSETWEAQLAILRRLMTTPGAQWFWANYHQEFGESFRREVDEILAQP